jgi:hypothetical protein
MNFLIVFFQRSPFGDVCECERLHRQRRSCVATRVACMCAEGKSHGKAVGKSLDATHACCGYGDMQHIEFENWKDERERAERETWLVQYKLSAFYYCVKHTRKLSSSSS